MKRVYKRRQPSVAARTQRLNHASVLSWASALSEMELISRSRAGIKGRELEQIQEESHLSNEELSRILHIAERTIQRYRKEERVEASVSEKALLLAQLMSHGQETFGSEERLRQWLESPSSALAGEKPIELLDSTTGMQVVKDELTRIDYGVY